MGGAVENGVIVADDFRADAEMNHSATRYLPMARPTDGLSRIGTAAAPNGIAGCFGTVIQHGNRGNAAELEFSG
jgi:hypothetical protein